MLSGCGGEQTGYHVGRWELLRTPGTVASRSGFILDIRPSGRFTEYFVADASETAVQKGRYKVAQETATYTEITIKSKGSPVPSPFRAYDSVLINYTQIGTFRRTAADTAPSGSDVPFGTWEFPGDGRLLIINDDGTLSIGGEDHYTYVKNGGAYIVTDTITGKAKHVFCADGDTLDVLSGDVYVRVNAG